MYRIFFFSLTLISALISGLSAQNCNPLTGLQANNRFPFGEAVTFEVVGETGVDFEVKIGMTIRMLWKGDLQRRRLFSLVWPSELFATDTAASMWDEHGTGL